MKKNKKYNLVLGLMIFFFILFIGVCVAWGLSYTSKKSNSNEINNSEIIDINIKEQTNNSENGSIKYPYEINLQSGEITNIITMLEAKIKFVDPSENYKDNFTNAQIIGAAMFFYINDNPKRDYTGYIYTDALTPVIKKYFGIENITYGELKGTNYTYLEEKQAYEEPVWGTTKALFIKKAEYFDKSTIRVHIDMVETSKFENSESITKDTYTEDMVENRLIVTIKLNNDGSFILTNYGYNK